MANELINGPQEATPPPAAPTKAAGGLPTWGYDAVTAEGTIFDLSPGEGLPDGYVDTPAKVVPAEPEKPKRKARDGDGA